ncbi:Glutathione S-transferase [Sesamum angolense]|uniref:glutathione transferase n=1 Tax=Sesamum angolense TaxID=2727404 RepID=A0AAE1X9U9_9LAMI|nr:Glutathione S-transferase [Sesamum angolense]
MAMKLHGHPLSPATHRVMACLEEKGVEYEFVHIHLSTAHHKESFLSLNPFGQVPALEDGDLKLFESRAITQHLAHTYADNGTPLVPQDPKERAIVYVWMEVESQRFDATAAKLSYELVTKPMLGMTTNDAVVEEHQEKLGKVLDIYESRLAKSKYLGGEVFSLADLHHLPIVSHLFGTKTKALFDARTHVSGWGAGILARPAWQKVVEKMKH